MKHIFCHVVLSLSLLSSQISNADDITGSRVRKPAKDETPYLENVRSFGAIMKSNVMSLLDASHPKYSVLQSMIFAHRIAKVAKLFAYANFVREIESQPEKYGPLRRLPDCHKHCRATHTQLRARAVYLSKSLRVVFKKDIREVKKFSKKAALAVDNFHYRIQSLILDLKPSQRFTFTRQNTLMYLKFIETEGYLDTKGPKYMHVHEMTGAEEEYYYFTWTTVTLNKLARAIVEDRFELMKQVMAADKVASGDKDNGNDDKVGDGNKDDVDNGTDNGNGNGNGDISIPDIDDIPLPEDLTTPSSPTPTNNNNSPITSELSPTITNDPIAPTNNTAA